MRVEIDFETKSYADLKEVGAWVYSEHPTTQVICLCYGIDNQPIQTWLPGQPPPADLLAAIEAGALVEAHNAAFEISIWANVMVKRHGWPEIPLRQWRDSMAVASYYAMPAALDNLARALGYRGKDPEGARLITKYCKLHLKKAKPEIPPEDLAKFVAYCQQDVRVEQSVSDELGDLPPRELEVFLLDLKVNLRGIFLDLEGIENASAIIDQREAELRQEFVALVGCNPTQRDKVMAWFAANGLELDNLQAEYLEGLLDDEDNPLPSGPCRRALQIRLAISKASTKKLDAMARQRGADGRARFQTRYHGAATGRNTGAGFQPLNLSRGFEKVEPDQLVRDISYRDARWLDCVYEDAMDAVAKAARHWIKAEPGNKIMSGDFVSIEAVLLACLAGEEWKIQAFRDKAPLYAVMGCKIHGMDPQIAWDLGDKGFKELHGEKRQDGKIGELAFGYGGGLNAWLNFDSSGRHTDEGIQTVKKAWRGEHPMTEDFWYDLERAAIEAVRHPGRETSAGMIGFEIVDEWLSMILPDGKRIWYRNPQLRHGMPPWHKPLENEDCAAGSCKCRPILKLSYMAQKFGQWRRVYTYGGKLAENATQATSRQVLVPALLRAEAAGYHVILSVYDEIVCEVKEDFGSEEEFVQIMSERPDFARDWPISVDAWSGLRYRK